MVLKSDQQRIKTLLQEAIPLLCKNGLSYQSEFCIEALIGITLDQNDVFLVNINERVCSVEKSSSSSFHEETRIECGGTGDARSVDLCDPVSENEGRDNIKTVQKFRIASQSLFRKQTRACARESGEDVSESKNFDRYSNGGRSSEKRRIKETEAHSDFADSYEVSVDADFGSPPLKKQAREWGSDTQTHIKQEPEFCEIIDPSDTEPDDNDFKDPRTFSAVPTTSENTAESSADMYSMYSAGLDGLEASSSVPSGTPSGSGVTSYAGSVLNRSSSLAQALPELSMTSPPVAGQSTVGCGQLPSYPANPSQVSIRALLLFIYLINAMFLLSTTQICLPSLHRWRPIVQAQLYNWEKFMHT